MAHSTPSLTIPPSLSTSSLLTCTPISPSTRPSTGPLQISSSDEIYHREDPVNVSFGSLADMHSHSPSTTTPNRSSWVVISRGKNRYVDELHLRDPGHNPTSSELLLERSIAKESELCSTEMEQSSVEETHATQLKCTIQKKLILLKKGSGMTFLPASFSKETLQAEISKTGHEIGTSL